MAEHLKTTTAADILKYMESKKSENLYAYQKMCYQADLQKRGDINQSINFRNENKFIYFAIPKTGSSSIRIALQCRDLGHIDAFGYKEIFPLDLYNEYYKFSFVRNPYDWITSVYRYKTNTPASNRNPDKQKFEEWLIRHTKHNLSIQGLGWPVPPYIKNQIDWLIDPNTGEMLVDEIFRYEDINEEWKLLTHKIFSKTIELPKNHWHRTQNFIMEDAYYTNR